MAHGRAPVLRSTLPLTAAALSCALAGMVTGCGSSGRADRNIERPPEPVVVSVAIDDTAVQVSPARLGAGPITLVIANLSNTARRVTLESDGRGPGQTAVRSGPIAPREATSVKANVEQGTYVLRVGGDAVRPTRLTVGRPRPSSQDELLQP
jgi:hypothetical protein